MRFRRSLLEMLSMFMFYCCREKVLEVVKDVTLDPTNNTDYRGNPYPFGMDPVSHSYTRIYNTVSLSHDIP